MRAALAGALALAVGCKSKPIDEPMPEPPLVPDAKVAVPVDVAEPWRELEGLPRVSAERVIALPAKPDTPRFALAGPVLAGDLAIVASSQFGFLAADWRKGSIAWTKPAGTQVAPPVVVDGDVVLMGDCARPPVVGDREVLVGCLRVVSAAGVDRNYVAIRGKPRSVDAFLADRGPQRVDRVDEHTVRWQRGDAAITVDLVTGVAKHATSGPPPLVAEWRGKRWEISHEDQRVVARQHGKIAWQTEHPYTAVVGLVWAPEMGPTVRIANANAGAPPYVDLIDIDATGSLRASVASKPTPGIGVLAHAASSIGDTALAVRLDSTLRRDVVSGYAANQLLMWVYPLPEHQRVDPVGIAISDDADAVVVFHDGDTLTVLPELSAPPTSLGAGRASSKKPTP